MKTLIRVNFEQSVSNGAYVILHNLILI